PAPLRGSPIPGRRAPSQWSCRAVRRRAGARRDPMGRLRCGRPRRRAAPCASRRARGRALEALSGQARARNPWAFSRPALTRVTEPWTQLCSAPRAARYDRECHHKWRARDSSPARNRVASGRETEARDGLRRLPAEDAHGLTMWTGSAEAGAAMERALSSFLKCRLDAREHLSRCLAADPEFGLAHCLKGYFTMLLYKQASVTPAAQSARTARALVAKATAREQAHVEALEAWGEGDLDHTLATLYT